MRTLGENREGTKKMGKRKIKSMKRMVERMAKQQ